MSPEIILVQIAESLFSLIIDFSLGIGFLNQLRIQELSIEKNTLTREFFSVGFQNPFLIDHYKIFHKQNRWMAFLKKAISCISLMPVKS
jgi:hypothetical protein